MNFRKLKARGPVAGGLLAILAGGAGGCMGPTQRKLQGRWLGDSVQDFADQNVAAATGWAKGTSMEFAGTDITVAVPAEEPRTGTYRVVKVDGNAVELAVVRKDGVVDHARFVLDGRKLHWDVGGGRVVILRRED